MPEMRAVVIGGGPAGLMAAEVLASAGAQVDVFDAMPSMGRKFLLAGIGGMNITHAESLDDFLMRYRSSDAASETRLREIVRLFPPHDLRAWIHGLGIETFVGSSGRVFPREMKAAPLLRAWLHRLRTAGVKFHTRHRWRGWNEAGELVCETPEGNTVKQADVVVLALGGASWPRLGSDAAWLPWLRERGVVVRDFQAANSGFDIAWSRHIAERFAGAPLKPVVLSFVGHRGERHERQGELIVTANGIEGGLVYALSAPLRETIAASGSASIALDLAPAKSVEQLAEALSQPRGGRSLSEHLRRRANLHGVKAALLREKPEAGELDDMHRLAARIKALPLTLSGTRPLEEAISSAGGIAFASLDEQLMLRSIPGVFCAGEMLDWEAPTGGYLLTACLASGRAAGEGAVRYVQART